jgi:hypothetical protein
MMRRPLSELTTSLHDSSIDDLHYDIDEQTLELKIGVNEEASGPAALRLRFSGVNGFAVTLHGGKTRTMSYAIVVEWGIDKPPHQLANLPVPPQHHLYWFFVSSWNSFLGIVATEATFEAC